MRPRHHCRHTLISESLERRFCLSIESSLNHVTLDANDDLMSQSAAVAALGNGGSVSAYADRDSGTGKGNDVWLRRFNPDGSAIAAAERVNTTTAGAQMNVDVAGTAGDYAVVWQSENQDGSGWGIYARYHGTNGWSTETLVNQTTTGAQVSPKIAMSPLGGFIVTWNARDENAGNGEIYARRFDSSAVAATNEILVSNGGSFAHTAPDLAVNTNNVLTVVWVASDLNDSAQTDVAFRRLNATTLTALATAGTANTVTTGDQAAPAITPMNAGNDFLVAWSDTSASSSAAIFARRFDDTATTAFPQFQVSQDSEGNRSRPQVSSKDSTTVIGWTQQVIGQTSSSSVIRAYDGNLAAISNETPSTDNISATTLQGLAVVGNGRFRQVSTLGEQTGYGIASAGTLNNVLRLDGTGGNDTVVMYDLNSTTIRTTLNGTSVNHTTAAFDHVRIELGLGNDTVIAGDLNSLGSTINGGDGNDTITTGNNRDTIGGENGDDLIHPGGGSDYVSGASGTDRIYGDAGDDTLTGGAGKDTMWGGFGKDRINGSGSPDVLFGEDDDDRLYGELGDDRCDGGGGKDRLYGDDGNDLLVGNSSNDRIYAGDGNDTLNGGKGNYYLQGDNGTDKVLAKEPGDLLISIELS